MCGFAALFQASKTFDRELLQSIDNDLYHRGPDSGGIISEEGFALVFRRLSILDVTQASDQPMTDESGRYSIVFNGEIYNYKELRKQLIGKGRTFTTSGDTEVILQGYLEWGVEVLDKLEGMYAFTIVDRINKIATVARDPIGIKPLYLLKKNGFVGVASEMRPLMRFVDPKPDVSALSELLTFTWAGGNKSNIEEVQRVLPGTMMQISLTNCKVNKKRFFNILDTLEGNNNLSEDDLYETLHNALKKSVIDHLASDVGYSVQLSGGIDSSLIAAMSSLESKNKIKSFSVSLGDHPFDEGVYRKQVTSQYNLEHQEVLLNGDDFANALPRAIKHMEGPVPHGGCVMLMLLCDTIAKTSKVVLTGEGADEMFGGYERYKLWRKLALQEILGKLLPANLWPNIRPFIGIKRYAKRNVAAYACVYQNFLSSHQIFPDLIPKQGYRDEATGMFSNFRSRMLASDQTNYLESVLVRQDKMSMAASVEARVPFLHLPLLKLINSIPNNIRVPGDNTKPVLKKIADKYLSHDLVHRRKVGLLLPYNEWMHDSNGLGRYLELLESSDSRLAQYSDRKKLGLALKHFRNKNYKEIPNMMNLINIELWLRSIKC